MLCYAGNFVAKAWKLDDRRKARYSDLIVGDLQLFSAGQKLSWTVLNMCRFGATITTPFEIVVYLGTCNHEAQTFCPLSDDGGTYLDTVYEPSVRQPTREPSAGKLAPDGCSVPEEM